MKNAKKWIALLAALTMTLSVGALAACGEDKEASTPSTGDSSPVTPEAQEYKVTVTMPDGTPAANVGLNFCVGENCQPVTTDANGVAVFPFEDETVVYHVEYKLPLASMYEAAGTAYTDFSTVPGTLEYTMQINAYVDPDSGNTDEPSQGTPLSGTGSYEDPFVMEPNKTYLAKTSESDALYFSFVMPYDGVCTLNLPITNEGTPAVNVANVDAFDGYSFKVKAGKTVFVYVSNSGWDESWNTVYYDTTFSITAAEQAIEEDGTALAPYTLANGTTYEVASWGTSYYTFTAPSDGQYKLSLADYATMKDSYSFLDNDYNAFYKGAAIDIKAGETLEFYANNYLDNDASWTFHFSADGLTDDAQHDEVIPVGAEDNPLLIEAAGEVTFTVEAGASYHITVIRALQFTVPTGCSVSDGTTTYAAGEVFAFTDFSMTNSFKNLTVTNTGSAAAEVTLNVTEIAA